MMRKSHALLMLTAILASPVVAWGHPGHAAEAGHGLVNGLWHPITGWDHMLALIGVGLLAARIGGRALWAVPVAFLGSCALGGAAALGGVSLPAVELMILASIFVPAWLLARGSGATLATAASVAILFGAFHGYAHFAEMAAADAVGLYALGLLAASASVLAVSVAAGLVLVRSAGSVWEPANLWRFAGAALSLSAVVLIVVA